MVKVNALFVLCFCVILNAKSYLFNSKLIKLVILFAICFMSSNTLKCSSSASKLTAITAQKDTFPGMTDSRTLRVVTGPVSNYLYFLYWIDSPVNWAIRKVDSDNIDIKIRKYSTSPIFNFHIESPNKN